MKSETYNIFYFLNAITINKLNLDFNNQEIYRAYDPYMINRWLSMVDIFIPFVAEINKYDVPKNVHYNYFKTILPKDKYYFNYLKKNKDVSFEDSKVLARHFRCHYNKIPEMVSLMDEKEVNQILNKYKDSKGNYIF